MSDEKVSVRDRRRLETLSQIHRSAQELVLSKGLAEAKVEEIAKDCGISRRTFFNYFATKEDAVLGLCSPTLPPESVDRFSQSKEGILARATWLVVDVIRTSTVQGSSGAKRKELRLLYPELTRRFEVRAAASEALVREVIVGKATAEEADLFNQDIDVLLGLVQVVIRHAYRIDSEIKDPSIHQAIEIFKSTIRKIT